MILEIALWFVLICELQGLILAASCFHSVFVGLNKPDMMAAKLASWLKT